jgi:hypothetical protein
MNEKMNKEELDLFPEHTFHRRFTAYGRSAYPLRDKSVREWNCFVVIVNDINASGVLAKPQERDWWKARNASFDSPLVYTDPFPKVMQAAWAEFPDAARRPARKESKEGNQEKFLEEVYRLGELNDLEGATDRAFRYMDDLLLEGAFPVCNEILKRLDVKRLPTALMRSFLTITAAAKAKLPARKAFYTQAFAEMVRVKGDAAKALRLLGRLA